MVYLAGMLLLLIDTSICALLLNERGHGVVKQTVKQTPRDAQDGSCKSNSDSARWLPGAIAQLD